MNKKRFLILLIVIFAIMSTVVLASCDKAEDIIDDIRVEGAEDIKYDGEYITWKKVNADYYTVSINGGTAQRSNSTTFAYDSQNTTFEVVITSVLGDSTATASKTFRPLGAIAKESIAISDDGYVSWEAVENANAYQIKVNGQILASPVTDTVYDQLQEGSNRISIKPIVTGDESYFSSWTEDINIYIYSKPTSLKYDGVRLSWSGSASEYEVVINGVSSIVKGNAMDYNSGNADFTVSIKAVGNHVTTFDSKELEDSYYYLNTVTNIRVVDGILTWDAIERAEGYKISINGVVQNKNLSENRYALASGQSIDVKLMPYNTSGNYFSSWTDTQTFYILKTPVVTWNNNLELDGESNNNFTWDAVEAAQGYTVMLYKDGVVQEPYEFSSIDRAFAYAYENVGVYEVSVKAVAPKDDATYSDSAYSKPIRIERLAAPKRPSANFIVSDASSLAKGFTVTFEGVSGATGYQLYKDGTLVEGKKTTGYSITDNNVVGSDIVAQQNYTYSVRSLGGIKTVSGITYVTLPCLSREALSFNITVQATPTGLTMSGFDAKWNAVPGNNGYCLNYGASTVTANTEKLNMDTIESGSYDVKVCARGNGSDILASNYSSAIKVVRIECPTNIKIEAGDGNGLLMFDRKNNASGYSAFIDLNDNALDETNFNNMYDYISEQGSVVSMRSDANIYSTDNTVYYMSSPISPTVQFVRLSAPTFPEGALSSQDALVWNHSLNINTAEYTPTYELIINNISQSVKNGTQFDLTALEAGTYTVTVKAIGNSTKYLDSDINKSQSISFTKLDTPEMSVEKDGYHWLSDANATSYSLSIDGERVSENLHVDGGAFVYMPKYSTVGDHIVKLVAVGNGINTISSNAFEYTQRTALLQTPTIEYSYSNDSVVSGGYIKVDITSQNENASGYLYEISGESVSSSELSYTKTIDNPGVCTIKVKAIGSTFDENDVYYLDSAYTQQFSITLLAQPNSSTFKINGNGEIIWSLVQNANGYDYQISYDGGSYTEVKHVVGNKSSRITDFMNYGKITIKVRASSNGGNNIVSSAWTEWTWINPNK